MPANDDYGYIIHNLTGNPLDTAIYIYYYWNGRLAANFFYSLFLPSLDFDLYRIITAACFMAFCFTFIALISALNLQIPLKRKIYIALLLLVPICVSSSYIHDIFFWMGGIANYLLPVIFLTAAYICAVKKVETIYLRILWPALSIILTVLSSMCAETFSMAAIWFSLVMTTLFILKKDRYRGIMSAIFCAALIAGLLVMYLSPGTGVREAGADAEAGRLFWALWVSLMTTFERSGEWLFLSQIIPAAILADIALKDIKLPLFSDRIRLRTQGLLLIIFGITCAWAAHFTISYALGYYGLPGRAKFVAQYFLQLPAFAGLISISRSFKLNEKGKTLTIAAILFVIMIIPSRHFAPSLMYIGGFSDYYDTLRERYSYLLLTEDDTVIFTAAEKAPPIIGYPYYRNRCSPRDYDEYYKKSCIRLDGRNDGYNNYPTLWTIRKK